MKKGALKSIAFFVLLLSWAQCLFSQTPQSLETRKMTALKLIDGDKIEVDGDLSDEAWLWAIPSSDFTQFEPSPWRDPSQRTLVRVAYDDEAIYVGARMYDTAPDSILKQLTGRDSFENTDEFGFWFSPYNDGNNGFLFFTNPLGVQVDMSVSPGSMDFAWNAVWKVETSTSNLPCKMSVPSKRVTENTMNPIRNLKYLFSLSM